MNLILLLFAVLFLVAFLQIGLLTIAFDKLGLSEGSGLLLLFASLAGSAINLPLFNMRADAPPEEPGPVPRRIWPLPMPQFTGRTTVALNVGGGLIPIFFSLYLIAHNPLAPLRLLIATALVSTVCYFFARPIPRLGIGMPLLIAPIAAALAAIIIDPAHSPPVAYISGTLGVLIGADLLHLRDIRHLGAPIAAIGGAGTFDGIFLTGIVAVLLA